MSLRVLAAAIDGLVTAQAIGMYERNESTPNSTILIALAKALNTSVDYLLADPELSVEGLKFRKDAFTSKRDEAQVEATVLLHLEKYLEVEEILQMSSVHWDEPRDAPYPVLREPIEADRAAEALRNHWDLGQEPIPNLVELLEERGVKILVHPLGNISGLAARASRAGQTSVPFIVVNSDHWGERQRFTMAHELAHLVLRVSPGIEKEKIANRFAEAFLIPTKALWLEVGQHRKSIPIGELLALKLIFGVSIQALTRRCMDLGIISSATCKELFAQFRALGWRTPPYREYGAMSGEEPMRFHRLCIRAFAEGAITRSKMTELLDVPIVDVAKHLNGTLSFADSIRQ